MAEDHPQQEPTPTEADAALIRAWMLGDEDYTDEVMDLYETLIPSLVAAGYAETEGNTWGYTPRGLTRAEELEQTLGVYRGEQPTQPTQPKGIDPKTGKSYEPVEVPVPKRGVFDGLLRRAETKPPPKD